MDATEICALTYDAVSTLLADREARARTASRRCRRRAVRWSFPGTVELWLPDEDGRDRHVLATSVNLSGRGIGIRSDEALPVGLTIDIAVHEPEVSFHGRAVVRHCTNTSRGFYLVGMQFLFEE